MGDNIMKIIKVMLKIMDNYGGKTCQLDLK